MRITITALSVLIAQVAIAQTTTNCLVNGQWIRCTSQPSVVVLPPRPDPIGDFLKTRSAELKAKNAQQKEEKRQAAMMLANQFAQLPLDIQVANYEKLPDEVKQYVLDPRLLTPPPQPPPIADKDKESLDLFVLKLRRLGINTLDDLQKFLADPEKAKLLSGDDPPASPPAPPVSVEPPSTVPAGKASASDPRCSATASGGIVCPPRETELVPERAAVAHEAKERQQANPSWRTAVIASTDDSTRASERCTSLGLFRADCNSCSGTREEKALKLRKAIYAETERRGGNHVSLRPSDDLSVEAEAFACP